MRGSSSSAAQPLLLSLLLPGARSWTTISQASYGATIENIYNESLGHDLGTPVDQARMQSLGYLWSLPCERNTWECVNRDPQRGLGGTITWAWDPSLCDELLPLFADDFWSMSFMNCELLKGAVHRAFDTWAMNSRFIKFTEVTSQCEAMGMLGPDCPLAKIWVTPWMSPVAEEITSWSTTSPSNYPPDFLSTNQQTRIRRYGPSITVARPVVETARGVLSLRTSPTMGESNFCYYLDSDFCASWHSFKRFGDSKDPMVMHSVGVTFVFGSWLIAMIVMLVIFALRVKRSIREHIALKEGGESVDQEMMITALQMRLEGVMVVLMETPILTSALRVFLIMAPWPFYAGIFHMCWDCYDFEAAVAQEVGTMLGLGHPDTLPRETREGFPRAGQNSYHAGLAAGGMLSSSTCGTPEVWAEVREGLPPGAESDFYVPGIRESIMTTLTPHNPLTCLTADDLEAINVLYPDCLGGATEPVCAKTPYNMGGIRVSLFFLVPYCVSVMTALLIWALTKWKLNQLAQNRGLTYEAFARPGGRLQPPPKPRPFARDGVAPTAREVVPPPQADVSLAIMS